MILGVGVSTLSYSPNHFRYIKGRAHSTHLWVLGVLTAASLQVF